MDTAALLLRDNEGPPASAAAGTYLEPVSSGNPFEGSRHQEGQVSNDGAMVQSVVLYASEPRSVPAMKPAISVDAVQSTVLRRVWSGDIPR
jgi:hypothetical protein